MAKQGILFDQRFLERHAGPIMSDTAVSVVELLANAWDAYACQVNIVWPSSSSATCFSITDDGKGMTARMFEARWRKLDYNRLADAEGVEVESSPRAKGSAVTPHLWS